MWWFKEYSCASWGQFRAEPWCLPCALFVFSYLDQEEEGGGCKAGWDIAQEFPQCGDLILSYLMWFSLAVLLHCRDWRDKASKSTFAYYIIGRMLISFQSFPGLVPESNCCAAHQPELHVCYQKSSLQSMLARRKGGRTKMLIEQCKACVTLCLFCWTCRIFSETLPVRESRQYEVCDPCPSVPECLPQARDKKINKKNKQKTE